MDDEAPGLEVAVAALVVSGLLRFTVEMAVDLHHETGGGAEEVQDIVAQRMLAAEDRGVRLASAQAGPEQDFGFGKGAAEGPGALRGQHGRG